MISAEDDIVPGGYDGLSRPGPEQLWIRPAVASDAGAIAHVHVESWRTTYGGLLPAGVLQRRDFPRRMLNWIQAIGPGPSTDVLIAETGDGLAGFVSVGPNRAGHPGYGGEIYALYLLREAQGLGIGRRLFQAGREQLARQGHAGLIVWMLAGNPAAGFYAHLGGEAIDRRVSRLDEARVQEVAYGWPAV